MDKPPVPSTALVNVNAIPSSPAIPSGGMNERTDVDGLALPESETHAQRTTVVSERYAIEKLEILESDLSTIKRNKTQRVADASDATLRVLEAALDGRGEQSVPAVGEDGAFRAWVNVLRPALVSFQRIPLKGVAKRR
jgi:hypothetical protein